MNRTILLYHKHPVKVDIHPMQHTLLGDRITGHQSILEAERINATGLSGGHRSSEHRQGIAGGGSLAPASVEGGKKCCRVTG